MSRIGGAIKGFLGILKAVLQGKLLMKLKMDHYIFHIAWLFVVFAAMIGYGMIVDNTLAKIQKNKSVVSDLEIKKAERLYELESLKRVTTLEEQLEELGSDLKRPDSPLMVIED